MRHGLLPCPLLAAWFLRRHEARPLGERARQKAQLLHQPAPGRHGRGGRRGDAPIVHTPCRGLAEEEEREEGIDQPAIVYRVVLGLPARTCGLVRRVLGADEAPCRPVMGPRGAAGAATGTAATAAGSCASGAPPGRGSTEGAPGGQQRGPEDINPWMGFALPQAAQASLDHLERRGLAGGE